MREKTIFIFTFLMCFSIQGLAFAQEEPNVEEISISTDKVLYSVGDTIEISGEVTNRKMPEVALRIFDPEDQILGAYSVEINETNHFTKTIVADVPFYEKSGTYTVLAEYGKISTDTVFEIENITNEVTDPTPSEEELTITLPQVISFESDKKKYENGDTIIINGKVSTLSTPQVTVAIFDPSGQPAGIYLAPVKPDLSFSTSFLAKYGVNFKVEGDYSITAQYGGPNTRKNIEIEFSEKPDENVSPSVPNIIENTDNDVLDSFLLSESDLEILANWYYLDGDDDQLASLIHNLLKKGLIAPDVNQRITTDELVLWIRDARTPLGITVNDLFKEEVSEEEFFTIIEDSIKEHFNKLGKESRTNDVLNTLPLEQSPLVISDKDKTSKSRNDVSQKLDPIENKSDSMETVYFNSSEDCKKRLYEDIVTFYNNPGPALARLCKFEAAIFSYDQTLISNPTHVIALTDKGSALASLGRYQEAIESYDKVLKIDPYNVNALNNKGNALSSLSKYQEAIESYDKVLKIDPYNEIVFTNKEKASSFLTVYHVPEAEPKVIMISDEPSQIAEEIKPMEKLQKDDDIVTQFTKVFSSISASLMSLFIG